MDNNPNLEEVFQLQVRIFGRITNMLKQISDDLEDLQKRVTDLERASPPGYNEPNTTKKAEANGQNEKSNSKTPAQDRLKRYRE